MFNINIYGFNLFNKMNKTTVEKCFTHNHVDEYFELEPMQKKMCNILNRK